MSQTYGQLVQSGLRSFRRGDFHAALGCFGKAAARARREGATYGELRALAWIQVALFDSGQYRATVKASRRLLKRASESGQEEFQMRGRLLMAAGLEKIDLRHHYPTVKRMLLRGLDYARSTCNNHYICYHLTRLGGYAVRVGELQEGAERLYEARDMLDACFEIRYLRYCTYVYLSRLMQRRGEHDEAVRDAEIGLRDAQAAENPVLVADARLTLARALQGRGDLRKAFSLADEVLSRSLKLRWLFDEQEAQRLRAELLCEMGRPEEAEVAARRALELASATGMREHRVLCLISLGRILMRSGRDEAAAVLSQARRLARRRQYDDHARTAEGLLQALPKAPAAAGPSATYG